ncbi:choline transporter-like protein 1 [Camelus ferus]|nr:choline transporter-like protein 1 [Camelus ferus]
MQHIYSKGMGYLLNEKTETPQVFIMGYLVAAGATGRLLFGYDSFGNVCGKKNSPVEGAPLSGQDMTLKKKRMKLTVKLLQVTSRAISNSPFLLLQPLWTFATLIFFWVLWVAVLPSLGSAGTKLPMQREASDASGTRGSKWEHSECEFAETACLLLSCAVSDSVPLALNPIPTAQRVVQVRVPMLRLLFLVS